MFVCELILHVSSSYTGLLDETHTPRSIRVNESISAEILLVVEESSSAERVNNFITPEYTTGEIFESSLVMYAHKKPNSDIQTLMRADFSPAE